MNRIATTGAFSPCSCPACIEGGELCERCAALKRALEACDCWPTPMVIGQRHVKVSKEQEVIFVLDGEEYKFIADITEVEDELRIDVIKRGDR